MRSRRSLIEDEPNRIAIAVAETRRAGRPILDLTVSNPTGLGIPYEERRILEALGSPDVLRYEPAAFGLHAAREAVAELWRSRGLSVSRENVALTASTSEAYSVLFKLLCDPGDAVLVPEPSYPLFSHLARFEGIDTVPYRLAYDGAWRIDTDSLARAVTPRCRAVVLVSPNNPTGSYVKTSELARVAALGLPVISDEVFGEYALRDDPSRARSALSVPDTLVFALDGLSKLALLPQMKLGWITTTGPGAAVKRALDGLELILDTYLSAGTPAQTALPTLLDSGRSARAAARTRTLSNLSALRRITANSAVSVLDVEGGWSAVLRLPAVMPEEDLVLSLLEAEGVLVQPGFFYDFDAEAYAVVSLVTEPRALEDGATRLVDFVKRL